MASLLSLRVDDTLKEQFLDAANHNRQSQSEAMRAALLFYIRRAKDERVREQSARIRANVAEEADVMAFIAAHSVAFEDD